MAFLTRILAAAALFSFAYAAASGPSAAENYAVAARRAREHHQRAPLVRAAPDRVRKRAMEKRCKASTPSTTTTSSYSTSNTWHPDDATPTPSSSSLSTSSTAQPPAQTPKKKKKCLPWGGSNDELAAFVNENVGCIYNWREDPPQQYGLLAGCMLWGLKNLDGFRRKRSEYTFLMGPNEFNLDSQAGLSVSEVVNLWNAEIRPFKNGKILCSPSVTTAANGIPDMQEFLSTCGGNDNCGFDVISAHYYGKTADGLIEYVTKMHSALNYIPIFISEFACQDFAGQGDCDAGEAWAFMEGVVNFCETTDWILWYGPFGFMKDLGNVNPVNALMDQSGNPTPLADYFLKTTVPPT